MSEADDTTVLGNNNTREKMPGKSRLGMKSFIVSFGIMGSFSWGLYTVIISQISTLEKAFGLSSAESGWLLTVWEIGYVVCTSFAGYFSQKAHIPRVISLVTIISGISGIVTALPNFLVFDEEEYSAATWNTSTGENVDSLCLVRAKATEIPVSVDEAHRSVPKKTLAFALFNLGMILQGIGKGPCQPYSSQYVDDNGDKKKTGFYLSIMWSIAVFGLAIGYAIGSFVSKVYVTLQPTVLAPTDSRFIGAWWLGFVVLGALTILSAIPMFFFPRHMTDTKPTTIIKEKQTSKRVFAVFADIKEKPSARPPSTGNSHHDKGDNHDGTRALSSAAGKAVLEILMTPIYVLTLIGATLQILAFATFFGFEPKYMESQFSVPAWQSNIMLGVASIGAYCVGSILGGYITKRFDMSPYTKFKVIVICVFMVNLTLLTMMFIGCPTGEVYNPLTDKSLNVSLDCDCSETQFLPICGDDGRNYFSPCHAGCTDGTLLEYSNCAFIPGGTAKAGMCPTGCKMVWLYATVRFFGNLIEAVTSLLAFLVFLRSVSEDKKAFAVGLSSAITSLLSWLPGPVIGGNVIDTTCLIWKTASTSGKYCGHYDTVYQRRLLHGLQFGIRNGGLLFFCLALFKARKLTAWPSAETNQEEKEPES